MTRGKMSIIICIVSKSKWIKKSKLSFEFKTLAIFIGESQQLFPSRYC